jgi:acetyl-CoA C-acetyltransferase
VLLKEDDDEDDPWALRGGVWVIQTKKSLEQNNAKIGAAAICNGGGGASAIVIESI